MRPPPEPLREPEPDVAVPAPRYDEHGRYLPNEVPLASRLGRIALAIRRFASIVLDLAIFAALLALAMTVWSMRKG